MRRSDWAVAHHALSDAMPAALLGLVACGAVLYGTLEPWQPEPDASASTWPLMPLVAIAAWAGIGIVGELKVSMAHALARPMHRARLFGVRALVYAALLGVVAATVLALTSCTVASDPGPPLPFVIGLVAVAFGIGTLAGATSSSETVAVGGAIVGVAAAAAPVVMLVDFYGVSWARVTSGLGGWIWPVALVGVASLIWPSWKVVRQLPLRTPRTSGVAIAAVVSMHVLALGLIWLPTASRASRAEHGELIAIAGTEDGPRVVYSGTAGTVDGVYVERDEGALHIYGEGPRRGRILDAKLSPDGGALALVELPFEGEGRRMVFADLHSGQRLETEVSMSITAGAWAPSRREFAFIASGARSELSVADLKDWSIRRLPPLPGLPGSKVVGWRDTDVVVLEPGTHHQLLKLVPSTKGGDVRTIELHSHAAPVASSVGFAWLETDAPRGQRRWTVKIRGWHPSADPATADLGRWVDAKVAGFGFLDDDHVYVQLSGSADEGRRLFIVRRDGELTSNVEGFGHWSSDHLHRFSGPPEGPWLAMGVYGVAKRLSANGRVGARIDTQNLGSTSAPWIPTRVIPGGLAFVHHGELQTIEGAP